MPLDYLPLQQLGHVNHNHSTSGHTEPGRAGNASIAPSVHAHPAKVGIPHPGADELAIKSGAPSSAAHAMAQVTTPRWSHR
jgi:hypothetical protein